MLSVSFFQSVVAPAQQLQISSQQFHSSRPQPLVFQVHSKAKTRREDRLARHSRIRKKVEGEILAILDDFLTVPNVSLQMFSFTVWLSNLEPLMIEGTPERPRLSVFRSNKHLYVQVIDDTKMHTLAAASTMQKSISEEFNLTSGPTLEVARKIGEVIAKTCLEKGITKVAFDRGGYPYHGRVEAIADAARELGLQF
ncbi:hypothetical protein TIFTF001_017333 [Ficus carica]|uniref:Large ribosomal subunit protein uL18c n=1 Tax=Ficus carica TaxID=3494 RepID=A0AA88A214_FICCA|nr:hypothetical protein TIFTF001_017333 [Ficus carica]